MNNVESVMLSFVNNDSLWILFITIIVCTIYNFYVRLYLISLFRILATWLFTYTFSLFFVRLYGIWLSNKINSYAHSAGFIFSRANDAPKLQPEFSVYLEALNHDTWRNMYFLTGIVTALLVTILIEALLLIAIRIKQAFKLKT